MNQLYPIIRRVRRPLLPVDDPPAPVAAPAPSPISAHSASGELLPVEPLLAVDAAEPKPAKRKPHAKDDPQ